MDKKEQAEIILKSLKQFIDIRPGDHESLYLDCIVSGLLEIDFQKLKKQSN